MKTKAEIQHAREILLEALLDGAAGELDPEIKHSYTMMANTLSWVAEDDHDFGLFDYIMAQIQDKIARN